MRVGITETSNQAYIATASTPKKQDSSFFAALETAIGEKMEKKNLQDAAVQTDKEIDINEELKGLELLFNENPDLQKVLLELNEHMLQLLNGQDIDLDAITKLPEFTLRDEQSINLLETTVLLFNEVKRLQIDVNTTINMQGPRQTVNASDIQKLEMLIQELLTEFKSIDSEKRLQKLEKIFETVVAGGNKKGELSLPIANMPVNIRGIAVGKPIGAETLPIHDMSHQPVTKTEQFILHMGDKQNYDSRTNELIREFSNILAKSQLSQTPGATRLLIRLYPEQLGSLRIELLQKDGMMMARIMASTNMAKNMLDSQLHSLKQVFIQQNIQVDKLEITVSQHEQEKYLDQNPRDEGRSGEGNKETQYRNEKDSSAEFSEELKNVLFEMEV